MRHAVAGGQNLFLGSGLGSAEEDRTVVSTNRQAAVGFVRYPCALS